MSVSKVNIILGKIFIAFVVLFSAASSFAANPKVLLETDKGDITIELFPDKAPKTVENFLTYVDSGYYNGTIFHRVVSDFVVQGGGFTFDFQPKQTRDPIVNEAKNGLKNLQGTLSMARTSDPNSATSQFFINLQNNPYLDAQGGNPGYAVFGKVVEGFDVVKKIEKEPRGLHKGFPEAPNFSVRITKAERIIDKKSDTDNKAASDKKPAPTQSTAPDKPQGK